MQFGKVLLWHFLGLVVVLFSGLVFSLALLRSGRLLALGLSLQVYQDFAGVTHKRHRVVLLAEPFVLQQ